MYAKTFQVNVPNQAIEQALLHKINYKTKPLGALGMLESVALQIGLIQQTLTPTLNVPTMLVFAGDHGIVEAGVSPYPQTVTAQMVLNFLQGGAAINVFASQNNMALRVIDAGVNYSFTPNPNLIDAKIALVTRNYMVEPAMTVTQCALAIQRGAYIVDAQIARGLQCFWLW